MDFKQELRRVWPDCEHVTLGDHQVFFREYRVPAHEYHAVLKLLEFQHAIELTARDSYDAALAEQLLDQTERISTEHFCKPGITVFDHQFDLPYTFSSVVFVPPSIAQPFKTESEQLNRNTAWFFPAYEGEFADGESSKDFWHHLRRRDDKQISVIRWDRQPGWTRVQSYSKPDK